jgi:hypothetical protein
MSLFISNKNQELLWKIINKNEIISEMDIEFKIHWFKQTIGIFYDRYIEKKINIEELKKINNDFIDHIINDVKYIISYYKSEENYIEETEENSLENNNNLSSEFLEPKEGRLMSIGDELNEEYKKREEEYRKLLTNKPPDEIKFSEESKEERINDMAELLEKEKSQREIVDNEAHRMYEEYINVNQLKKEKNGSKDMDKTIENIEESKNEIETLEAVTTK